MFIVIFWLYTNDFFVSKKNNKTVVLNREQINLYKKQKDTTMESGIQNRKKYQEAVARYKDCHYMRPVENLQDLIIQLRASVYVDCIQKHSTQELQDIWGIKIFEVQDSKQFSENRIHAYGDQLESYQQAVNKPYQYPNDAYIVTRVYEGQKGHLYITANKDYIHRYKGFNQWIPIKIDNSGWNFSMTEFEEGTELPEQQKKLPGFIESATNYFYPLSNGRVVLSFSLPSLENNYVQEIKVKVVN